GPAAPRPSPSPAPALPLARTLRQPRPRHCPRRAPHARRSRGGARPALVPLGPARKRSRLPPLHPRHPGRVAGLARRAVTMTVARTVLQALFLLLFPPLLLGVITKTKAVFAGRVGAPFLQPYHDLLTLLRKGSV